MVVGYSMEMKKNNRGCQVKHLDSRNPSIMKQLFIALR